LQQSTSEARWQAGMRENITVHCVILAAKPTEMFIWERVNLDLFLTNYR